MDYQRSDYVSALRALSVSLERLSHLLTFAPNAALQPVQRDGLIRYAEFLVVEMQNEITRALALAGAWQSAAEGADDKREDLPF